MLLWTAVFTAAVFYAKYRYDQGQQEKVIDSQREECLQRCLNLKH